MTALGECGEVGVDTLRILFETDRFGETRFDLPEVDGWAFGSIPALGLTWAEGHPAPGALASAATVALAGERVRAHVHDRYGVRLDRGVSRSDQTVTCRFERPHEARAFMAGMAAVDVPRTETTRRGQPVHSISWTHPAGRRKLARVYDKGFERGGERWEFARMEDQRRYPSGRRPPLEVVADGEYLRGRFEDRFLPVRKAVAGVKAASFPVIAQALADEVRYGYRPWKEAERLAGSLVLLTGAGADAYPRTSRPGRTGPGPTFYRRRRQLRDAGYVLVDDLAESVEVNLGDVVDQALEVDWS